MFSPCVFDAAKCAALTPTVSCQMSNLVSSLVNFIAFSCLCNIYISHCTLDGPVRRELRVSADVHSFFWVFGLGSAVYSPSFKNKLRHLSV